MSKKTNRFNKTYEQYQNIDKFEKQKELQEISGTISFKESANRNNELIYRTNDGAAFNYVIPDVQNWQKLDDGKVLIECGRKNIVFNDFALKDEMAAKAMMENTGCTDKYAIARVGVEFGNNINVMHVAGLVEVDPSTGDMKELKSHLFDLCNPNHFIIGEYERFDGVQSKNEILKVSARDVDRFVESYGEFIFNCKQGAFATNGLQMELEWAREDLILAGRVATPAEVLLQTSENLGKPIVLLTSESKVIRSSNNEEIDLGAEDERLIGTKVDILGERVDIASQSLISHPETTTVLGIAHVDAGEAAMTIIEGEDCLYVSVDRYREMVREKTMDIGDGPSGGASAAAEMEYYRDLIIQMENLQPEQELDGPEVYPGPGITGPEIYYEYGER